MAIGQAPKYQLPLTLDELRTANEERDRVYPGAEYCNLAFRATEMAGEVGEACNAVKKLIRAQHGIAGNTEGLEHYIQNLCEELADAIITVDLLAMQAEKDLGITIDLSKEVRKKFNRTSAKINVDVTL